MEGLFFVVSPVWWVGSPSIIFAIIAVFFGIILSFFLYKKKQVNGIFQKNPDSYKFVPISPVDPIFIEKTLQEIRKYCSHKYSPMHSWAHIPDDIKSYVSDENIIKLILVLEEYEYTGKILDTSERELINHELTKLLQ